MYSVFNIDIGVEHIQKIVQRYCIFIAESYIEFFIIKKSILFRATNFYIEIIQESLLNYN